MLEPVVVPKIEWVKRLGGYGAAVATGVIASHVKDPELAGWLATGVSVLGGILLNRALPFVFPTRRKIRNHFGR